MIVSPDFVEHWKTRTLVRLLGKDEAAPVYVLRLWSHCQSRKSSQFKMSAENLSALCKFDGDAQLFEVSMIQCGFVHRVPGNPALLEATGWAEENKALIAAWANGSKGGRPKKVKPGAAADEAQKTHGLSDKIRVDKTKNLKVKTLVDFVDGEQDEDDLGPLPPKASAAATEPPAPPAPPVEPPAAPTPPAPPADAAIVAAVTPAEQVFTHWQRVMNHPRAKLGDKIRKLINERMSKDKFSLQDLLDAVDGCKKSPHHMGKNETGAVYDSLELIFRNADKVNAFIGFFERQEVRSDPRGTSQLKGMNYQQGL
jgi:hypothetical protein